MNMPAERDPVALAIESLLGEMELKDIGSVRKTSTAKTVVISFGEMQGEGETVDLALVRLANAMMENEKYTHFLIETLKPIRSTAA